MKEEQKEELKKSLKKSLLNVTLIPIIIFGIVVIVYCSNQFTRSIHGEVESGLKNLAKTAMYAYEREYPGDFRVDRENSVIYKGDRIIEGSSEILENYKENSGTDITIFYGDERVVTTIRDKENKPIIGTKANPSIRRDVLDGKAEHFYTKTQINNENYFSYYCPLYDSQNKCVGMVFAGKPSQYVSGIVLRGVIPIVTITAVAVIIIILMILRYSGRLTRAMQQLQDFLTKVEDGNFTTELANTVLTREDELGRIGKSAIQMQSALRDLVERDALTRLYNRHYGEIWLNKLKGECELHGTPFYIAIADIDFFKKFNDNYGHDCGDLVLKMVSNVLMTRMSERGYAARWGGEEFLLVFQANDLEQAISVVNRVAEDIKKIKVNYRKEELSVTVTIGITEGDSSKKTDDLIKQADTALYEGKESGRDRVVCSQMLQ